MFKIENKKQNQNVQRETSPKLIQSEIKKDQDKNFIENKETVETDNTRHSTQKITNKPELKQDQRKKTPELSGQEGFQTVFERRAFNLMKNWYPLKFKLPYPRKSLLNAYEQKEFIEFYNRFKNRPKISQSEVRFYKKYLV